jgi:hypothetical protein
MLLRMRRCAFPLRYAAPLLLLSGFALAPAALAASRDEGEAAFRAGDFAAAVALFEQAIAEGDNGNSTRYNLAVSQFRQNAIAEANANFRILFEQGFRTADVVYSLAVTEKLLGNTALAAAHFTTVAASTSELADEALAQLQALDANAPTQPVVQNGAQLASSLQVATGYNDAIVEVQDGKLTRNGDRYAETSATFAWQQPFGNPWGVNLNFSLYNNSYADTREQNFGLLGIGLQQTVSLLNQRFFWMLDVDASQLDTQGFQQSLNAGAGIEKQFVSSRWRLGYRYRISDSLSTTFDPFAGRHHRVQADYNLQPRPRHQLTLRAMYEQIEREPISNTESTLDLSRDLSRIDVAWAYQVTSTVQAGAGINYGDMRAKDYQQFTNGTRLRRREDSVGYSLSLRKIISSNFMLQASYNRNDNRSSLADFTYDQSIYEVGFAWTPTLR